nr:hypothetical protein [Tanacetum cinerariifolium]
EVAWIGDSLSSHFFDSPFKVKWKKHSRDASLVASSARILSMMLKKILMWSYGFSVSNLWNSLMLWISQMSWASNTSPVCSLGKVIEF